MTTKERLLAKVRQGEGCWIWQGGTGERGYGLMSVNNKLHGVHRLSYQEFKGEIPEGLYVCHTCDTPSCINPDHLFLGTQQDNMNDMISKNRANQAKGSYSGKAKLTETDVLSIRASCKTQRELGEMYGVSGSQIGNIQTKKNWRHI